MPSVQPVAQPIPPVPQPVAQPVPPVPQPVAQPVPPVPQPVAPPPQPQWHLQQQQPPQPVPPQRVEPDWDALADRNAADGKRRRRMKVIGVVAAVAVVGGLVAGGVLLFKGKKDDGSPTAGRTTQPASVPSASGTPGGQPDDPSKPIWEATTDPAPQDAGALFSALQVTINGATWNRTVVSLDSPCWDGNSTTGGLGKVLGDQGCQQVLRATYISGDSAVTVGVAVFEHKLQADTALKNFAGQLKGAPAPGSPAFCAGPGCTGTHNSLGRYDYFTVEGSAKGGNAPDATATAAAAGFAEHVKGQLLKRAKAASSAAPGVQGTPAG
ncbi:hypothetical protein ACFVUY_14260 [Kitasatospora sp. NPDC058063]|uniref:hypothetical protein n=1 Tax=unclassified Kitasatospora TaxID=2633591 RepID=UPI0036DBDDC8